MGNIFQSAVNLTKEHGRYDIEENKGLKSGKVRVLVYEAATAGSLSSNGMVSSNILCEGYGMLRTFTRDLKKAGHNVTTIIDKRLLSYNPPINAEKVIPSNPRAKPETLLGKLATGFDGVYVIAPESAGLLHKLVEAVVNVVGEGTSLNSAHKTIKVVADKARVYGKLRNAGLKVPETIPIDFEDYHRQIDRIRSLGFPLIFKPVDGVGASGLSVVRHEGEVEAGVRKLVREASGSFFLAQRFVRGIPASVSLIVGEKDSFPVALNRQFPSLSPPTGDSTYLGGFTPLRHTLKEKAYEIARETVRLFKGLRGYVCVDMVLAGDEPVIIEINPRLSASYIGISRVMGFNLAQSILDAVLTKSLPEKVEGLGSSLFLKAAYHRCFTWNTLAETYGKDDVVSPPFPVGCGDKFYALISTYSKTLRGAAKSFLKVKDQLSKLLVK